MTGSVSSEAPDVDGERSRDPKSPGDDDRYCVTHIQRRPHANQYSIEGLFQTIRSHMPDRYKIRTFTPTHFSHGLIRRVLIGLQARRQRGDLNHVTGDIHFVVMMLPSKRTILTVHDCEFLEHLSGLKRTLAKWIWLTLPVRSAAVTTVISSATRERLCELTGCPPDRIRVIPDCVSPVFRPSPKEFNERCPRILQIGTKSNKNLQRLIPALEGISCVLEIIGPLDDSTTRLLDDCGVNYVNHLRLSESELVKCYHDADIVVVVSTIEGFGMPIIEAQQTGRVVVTSNCSSMPEVAGEGARLVDPFSVEEIAAGIRDVIGDAALRDRLLAAGRVNAERFKPDTVSRQYAELYDELIAANGGAPPNSALR